MSEYTKAMWLRVMRGSAVLITRGCDWEFPESVIEEAAKAAWAMNAKIGSHRMAMFAASDVLRDWQIATGCGIGESITPRQAATVVVFGEAGEPKSLGWDE